MDEQPVSDKLPFGMAPYDWINMTMEERRKWVLNQTEDQKNQASPPTDIRDVRDFKGGAKRGPKRGSKFKKTPAKKRQFPLPPDKKIRAPHLPIEDFRILFFQVEDDTYAEKVDENEIAIYDRVKELFDEFGEMEIYLLKPIRLFENQKIKETIL